MFCVCFIQSQKTTELYIGYTKHLKRRLNEHNEDKNFSTKNKGPWELIYCECYRSKEDAKMREERLKYYGRALGQLKRRISNSFLS